MPAYQYLTYELLDEGTIARITLNRPEARNAQNRGLLVELGDAMLAAEADDQVRVVILAGAGPLFSAGHDLGSRDAMAERTAGPGQHGTYQRYGGSRAGAEQRMLQEWHFYFENTRRWRNLRKITVAQVQGAVYAAGLMLMWACDLIVAADNVVFADVVGTRLGMCGVEYFAHPWEFGPRKAKELLLTGDSIDAEEAHRLGMVSKIFPAGDLAERTLEFARRIAELPDDDRAADQGLRQPDRGQHGLLQRAERLLHAARAQPLALGRDPLRQDGPRPARGRHPGLALGAAHRARPPGSGPGPGSVARRDR